MGMFATLKDMLLTPKGNDEISHLAPTAPVVKQVAAPVQPALKEAARRPMTMKQFEPQAQNDELASLKSADPIAPGAKVPNMPVGGPTIKSKAFGGIRPKDLPFQVSGPESISAGQVSNIPIAVGNNSAKSGLGYSGPTLQDSSKRRAGLVPGVSGSGASMDT